MTLETTLKGVSRSFYLSLRGLPRRVRPTLKIAFLCCKAADTIADTLLVPSTDRLHFLVRFRASFKTADAHLPSDLARHIAVSAENPAERELLLSLDDLFSALQELPPTDQIEIRRLVQELTHGMITDLTAFGGENIDAIKALPTESDLDQYTYDVAGCVGRFWTRLLRQHYRFARAWSDEQEEIGERFGKGLQMVNILRDLPRDLQQGRCYLPEDGLRSAGIQVKDLLQPQSLPGMRPYLLRYVERTRLLLSNGARYARLHPAWSVRLKWVVLLPMQLGFQTLDRLKVSADWLDPAHIVKVSRRTVYQTAVLTLLQSLGPTGAMPECRTVDAS